MPRVYRCRGCGEHHPPPTGKHCRNRDMDLPAEQNTNDNELLTMLMEIKTQISGVEEQVGAMGPQLNSVQERMSVMEAAQSPPSAIEADSQSEQGAVSNHSRDSAGALALASPDTLRADIRLMRQAAERLQTLRLADSDEEDSGEVSRQRGQGKKTGSLMLASDKVKKQIDWPHFHVHRVAGGKRKGVAFAELRVEEFVYGFLTMLAAPTCRLDRDFMIEMLRTMMQDTMEFTWANVLNFYDMVSDDVEKGVMRWDNTDRIKELHMTYARTVFPEKKASTETAKPQKTVATANLKCCAPYQKRACEHKGDHSPFTHACAFCHRTNNTLCRHTETDCFKKMAEESKNAKGRE